MMPIADYKSEHKRLSKVLKGAKTAAAARELKMQRKEKPMMVSKCKMMNGMKMRTEDF
jgi:hypothetical protein